MQNRWGKQNDNEGRTKNNEKIKGINKNSTVRTTLLKSNNKVITNAVSTTVARVIATEMNELTQH